MCDSYSGENIIASNTGKNIGDGSITVDLKRGTGAPYTTGGIIFRYQDNNNLYWVEVSQTALKLRRRMGGTNTDIATAPATTVNVWYRFRVDIAGSTITVYQDGVQKLYSSNGGGTWSSGRVALLQIGYGSVWFDNVVATTNVNPATVVSYDDYDAWGMTLEQRSWRSADDARQRFKFTGKERDIESQYDYFGARLLDSRIGRWIGVDPFSDLSPHRSPYEYAFSSPLCFIDPWGLSPDGPGGDTARVNKVNLNWPPPSPDRLPPRFNLYFSPVNRDASSVVLPSGIGLPSTQGAPDASSSGGGGTGGDLLDRMARDASYIGIPASVGQHLLYNGTTYWSPQNDLLAPVWKGNLTWNKTWAARYGWLSAATYFMLIGSSFNTMSNSAADEFDKTMASFDIIYGGYGTFGGPVAWISTMPYTFERLTIGSLPKAEQIRFYHERFEMIKAVGRW